MDQQKQFCKTKCKVNPSDKTSVEALLVRTRDNYRELENGLEMYSAFHNDIVFVDAFCYMLPADNYQASYYCQHSGSRAIKYCRFCDATIASACTKGTNRNYDQLMNDFAAGRIFEKGNC